MIQSIAIALLAALVLAAPADATFPGENGKLAIHVGMNDPAETPPSTNRIGVVDPDGTGATLLTPVSLIAGVATWSPDGTKIAFDGYERGGSYYGRDLYVMNADGSGLTRLLSGLNATVLTTPAPAWSPDATRIAFSDGVNIRTIGADGSNPGTVTDNPYPDNPIGFGADALGAPDWSTRDEIVFARHPFGEYCSDPSECELTWLTPSIYAMGADGSGERLIASGAASASWSPDGNKIAFSDFNGRIYVVEADGTGLRHIETAVRAGGPVWSPDGTKFVFSSFGDVKVVNVDGTGEFTLLRGLTDPNGLSPRYSATDWQPIPNHLPDCAGVTATPNVLWPPNKKLRKVTLSGATDPDGDIVTLEVTGVTQDERAGRRPDYRLLGDSKVLLRAERDRRGDGRVYTVAFSVTDEHGAACSGTTTVSVPRHRRGNRPRQDD